MERGSKSAVDHAEHWSCNFCRWVCRVQAIHAELHYRKLRRFAVNGLAAAAVLRILVGFGFPPFALSMYDTVDYGWGQCLGLCWHLIGIPARLIF